MGTPIEYGFNDISNENILKAVPMPSFFEFFFLLRSSSFRVTPFSRQVVLCGREGGHNTSGTQTYSFAHEADPTLAWTHAGLCRDSCLEDGHSPGAHEKLQVVLGCPHSPLPRILFFPPENLDGLPRGSDPEVVVAHVCFLGRLTCERRQED